jgi:hypothetical protein
MPGAMQHARRIWPILTQLLVGTACIAGCHGREPLAVHLHDPLRGNERDVSAPDAGEGIPDSSAKPPRRRPSTDPPAANPPQPSTAGASAAGAGTAGVGTAGVAGSRPTRPFDSAGSGWEGTAGRSGVSPWVCGNGVIDPNEACEPTDLMGLTCVALGFEGGGFLQCSSLCSFDVSNCHLRPVDPTQPIDAGQDDDAGVAQP